MEASGVLPTHALILLYERVCFWNGLPIQHAVAILRVAADRMGLNVLSAAGKPSHGRRVGVTFTVGSSEARSR